MNVWMIRFSVARSHIQAFVPVITEERVIGIIRGKGEEILPLSESEDRWIRSDLLLDHNDIIIMMPLRHIFHYLFSLRYYLIPYCHTITITHYAFHYQ